MRTDPLVSIIVPVFNGEDYLRSCLTTIIDQCYSNIEVIVVNDGSTDSTGAILAELCKADDRVTRIDRENGGAAAARNAALDVARGEWVLFVDTDDMLIDECLVSTIVQSVDTTTDIVWFETNVHRHRRAALKHSGPANSFPVDRQQHARRTQLSSAHPCGERAQSILQRSHWQSLEPEALAEMILDESFNPVWNKAYRRQRIVAEHLRFPQGVRLGEDLLFNLAYFRKAKNSTHLAISGYHHSQDNSSSVTRRFTSDKIVDLLHVNNELLAWAASTRSERLIGAANFIRAKNIFSCLRDLHHPHCSFTGVEKLALARSYKEQVPQVNAVGLDLIRRLLCTIYNLLDHRTLTHLARLTRRKPA